MLYLILLHGLLAVALVAGRRVLRGRAFLVAAIGPIATLAWAAIEGPAIVGGRPWTTTVEWVPGLDLRLDLVVDAYGLAFVGLIGVAGLAIFLFAAAYFRPGPRVPVFAGTMVAFAGSMLGIVSSDHLISVFLFWELTTVTSYLLVGHDDTSAKARASALQAALVTGTGGLAMLAGFVVLAGASGSYLISDLVSNPPPPGTAVGVGWALVLVGAATKSAQVPFHGWLPGAMAAPTPASAFLHSATMVKAGVFLVGRLAPAALVGAPWWQPWVVGIGLATMVLGGWRALRQTDLKLVLAFGTVSQLGFLFLLAGSGVPALAFAAIALVLAHGLFKSALFLVVGTIDSATGTRDVRRLDGLAGATPTLFAAAAAAAASMAAVPLTFGFVAKEAAFDGILGFDGLLMGAVAAASVLTVAYTGRFLLGAFGAGEPGAEPVTVSRPGGAMVWSPLVLATIGIVLGLFPGSVEGLVDAAAISISGAAEGKLVVWPGLVPALGWSLGSLAIGLAALRAPRIIDRATDTVGRLAGRLPSSDGTFRAALTGLLRGADRITGVVQSGSLPTYLATIALVVVGVPGWSFVRSLPGTPTPPIGPSIEIPLAIVVVMSAIGLIVVRRRFAAVILLGGVGYGIAGIYAVIGGPDLALTQVLVETLAVALFALVLRHLPAAFTRASATATRIVTSVAVAAFVMVAGLVAVGARTAPPVSDYYLAESLPGAAARNVVNAILVDFRALDTLGEITVLAVATLGVAALVIPLLRRGPE